MKVFGFWERLTKIIFMNSKQVTVEPVEQTADSVLSIPDVSPAAQEVVLTEQTQTLKNKTISGAEGNTFQAIPGAALNDVSVTAAKLDPDTVAGLGLTINTDGGAARLDVKPDGSSIVIATDTVSIKDDGVTEIKIATGAVTADKIGANAVTAEKLNEDVAGAGLVLGAANAIEVNPDDVTLELNADEVRIKDLGVSTAKLADLAVEDGKIAANTITLPKLAADAANKQKVLKRDAATGAVIAGNSIPDSGNVLTDSAANTEVKLKTLDRLQTSALEISMVAGVNYVDTSGNRVGLVNIKSSVTNVVNEIRSVPIEGGHFILVNKTIAPILIDNDNTDLPADAANGILTGTGGPINLAPNAALFLVYQGDAQNAPFDGRWHIVGGTGGGAGGTVTQVTTPVAHGFTNADKGKVLYLNGSVYTEAIATADNTAEVVGILANVIDADTFELATGGAVEAISGDDFEGGSVPAVGTTVFLSPDTAGKLTATEPTVVGHISKPLGVIFDTNKLFFYNMRGVVVGAANLRTQIGLSQNASTPVQKITSYAAGELAGWVELNATADYKFYVQAQFVKNAAGAWNLSYQTTGDTPPAGFSMDVNDSTEDYIEVTLPAMAGFVDGKINFALNAPAVGTSLPLQVDSTAITYQASPSYRNRIINGDMRIDQRNAGTAVSYTATGNKYITDRFLLGLFGSTYSGTVMEAAQVDDAPIGFSKSLKVTAKQNVAFDTNKLGVFITHKIEGQNIIDLGFGLSNSRTLSISFWVKSNKTGTVSVNLENGAADRSYGTTVTISQAATWEYKTISLTADTSGTWLKDNGIGLTLNIGVGNNGSWLTGAAGSWSATRAMFNAAQTNFLSTTNDYLAITGVQLEAGSVATPFEHRPIGMELQLCQRYYEKFPSVTGASFASEITDVTNRGGGVLRYLVEKRAIPTIEFTAATNYKVYQPALNGQANANITCASVTGHLPNTKNVRLLFVVASGILLGAATECSSLNTDGTIGINAEL